MSIGEHWFKVFEILETLESELQTYPPDQLWLMKRNGIWSAIDLDAQMLFIEKRDLTDKFRLSKKKYQKYEKLSKQSKKAQKKIKRKLSSFRKDYLDTQEIKIQNRKLEPLRSVFDEIALFREMFHKWPNSIRLPQVTLIELRASMSDAAWVVFSERLLISEGEVISVGGVHSLKALKGQVEDEAVSGKKVVKWIWSGRAKECEEKEE